MPDTVLPFDDQVDQWREWFPVTERWIYLNHAAVAPISTAVHTQMIELLDGVLTDGVARSREWMKLREAARTEIAALLGTSADRVAFAKNTTEGLNFVANGIRWNEGDEIVTATMEFPANRFPWLNLAGFEVKTVLVADDNGCLPVDRFVEAITRRTRVVSVSAVQYVSGWRVDLASLGAECRKRDILFVVDGIQALGALALRPEDYGIDVVAADGHKWLCGPEGAALVWFSERALDRLRVSEAGWACTANPGDYPEQRLKFHPHARRFECGTIATAGVAGLGAAVRLVNEVGIERIEHRTLALADMIRFEVTRRGWRLFGPVSGPNASAIVSFDVGRDAREVVLELLDEGVQAATRSGFVRLSPHFYTAGWEIEKAMDILSRLLKPRLTVL